jgi:hypothetical protein
VVAGADGRAEAVGIEAPISAATAAATSRPARQRVAVRSIEATTVQVGSIGAIALQLIEFAWPRYPAVSA